MAYSAQGHVLAAGGLASIDLWDVTETADPSLMTTLTRFNDGYAGAFSPDGHTLAVASTYGTVELWAV